MRICFVGDSFVNGTGDSECLGWAGRICVDAYRQGYEITYYNLGVRRDTSFDIRSRWFKEVSCRLPKKYDRRIVFSFGVNDIIEEDGQTRVTLTDSVENTKNILTKAQELYPVLMVGPPPLSDDRQHNQRIAHLSAEFALVCRQLDIPYLDIFTPLQRSNIWLNEVKANDGAHPQANGYQIMADIVQNWDGWLNWFKFI